MPAAVVHVRRARPDAEVSAIVEAVYLAQREALRVPEGDRNIRYVEHAPERFAIPPDRSDDFTHIEISLFAGRSVDTKRALYAALTRRLGAVGIAADDVFVVLHEEPRENWGIRGRAASDVDLGFEVEI